jgi:hypothetical protein
VKGPAGTIAAIGVLSLVVWALVSLLTPGAPLTQPETVVVVGACAAVVLAVRWVVARRRRPRGQDGAGT